MVAAAAGEPAAWAAEAFAEPELGSEELEAAAGGALDRVLLESVCQQQGWVRVYGEGAPGGERGGPGPMGRCGEGGRAGPSRCRGRGRGPVAGCGGRLEAGSGGKLPGLKLFLSPFSFCPYCRSSQFPESPYSTPSTPPPPPRPFPGDGSPGFSRPPRPPPRVLAAPFPPVPPSPPRPPLPPPVGCGMPDPAPAGGCVGVTGRGSAPKTFCVAGSHVQDESAGRAEVSPAPALISINEVLKAWEVLIRWVPVAPDLLGRVKLAPLLFIKRMLKSLAVWAVYRTRWCFPFFLKLSLVCNLLKLCDLCDRALVCLGSQLKCSQA